MNRSTVPALILLLTLGAPGRQMPVPARASADKKTGGPSPEELTRRAAVIKPGPDENRWQQVPWVTDLNEGLRLARAEKRPLLLWAVMGEPLDEC